MSPEPKYQRWQRWATIAMALCGATSTAQIVAEQVEVTVPVYFESAVAIGLALFFGLRPGAWSESEKPSRMFDFLLVGSMLWPFLASGLFVGLGIEYRIVLSLRNVGLIAAALAFWPKMRRMALLTNLLLMIFSFTASRSGWHFFTTLGYLLSATLWMVFGHWHVLEQHASRISRSGMPRVPIAMTSAFVMLSLLVGILAYPTHVESVEDMIRRIFGSGKEDVPGALQGRRMQEDSTAALMAMLAAGRYGASMGPGGVEEEVETFSTIRDPDTTLDLPENLEPLFHTKGRQALHLPMKTFARFDGQKWFSETPKLNRESGQLTPGGDWINSFNLAEIPLNRDMVMAARESDIPTDFYDQARAMAAYLAAFGHDGPTLNATIEQFDEHIRQAFAQSALLSGEAQYLITQHDMPALMESLGEDAELRNQMLDLLQSGDIDAIEAALLDWRQGSARIHLPPNLEALVREWIDGRPRGWPQIEGVVDGLRSHCEHDPDASIPPGTKDSVEYFLLESRRGPDYMFASSATTLLRGLAYPSRMVSGFYAPADRFGFLTGRAAVDERDLHYWTQVQMPDGTWVDLEPTPGYEVAQPVFSLSNRLAAIWSSATEAIDQHLSAIIAVVIAVAVAMTLRVWIVDLLCSLTWQLGHGQGTGQLVLRTWRLIEGRAHRAGNLRPAGSTLAAWYPLLFAEQKETCRALSELASLADQVTFSPRPLADDEAARRLCRVAVKKCTLGTFRRLRAAHTDEPAIESRENDFAQRLVLQPES